MEDFGILLVGVGAMVMGLYHVTRRQYVAQNEIGAVISTCRGTPVVCLGLSEICVGIGISSFGSRRMLGLIIIVLSLGGVALGVLDLVAPTQFQRGMQQFRSVLTGHRG